MKPTLLRDIPALMMGAFLFSTLSLAMESDTDGHHLTNAHISTQLEITIATLMPGNTVVSALGVHQVLGDLAQFSDKGACKEITQFTGSEFTLSSYKGFIDSLPQNTDFPAKKPKTKKHSFEDEDFIFKKPTNAFYNGHFILYHQKSALNFDRALQLKSLKAEMMACDFSDPTQSANTVNGLVNKYTNEMIPSIVTPDAFSNDPAALVLLSTLYINNAWLDSYNERRLEFKGLNGKKMVEAFGSQSHIPYYQTATDTTVLLPATGDTYLMVRMQNDGTIIPINHTHISTALNRKKTKDLVNFSMPAFTIENEIDLQKLLENALPSLMSGQEFTIDLFETTKQVYVGKFIQKNKLDVTKDGLEGASATMMMLMEKCCAIPPKPKLTINIDRPFAYTIIKMLTPNTWLPLFAGQIIDPIAPQK